MLIGPGKSGPVIVAIQTEKDDVPAALRRAVAEFNLEMSIKSAPSAARTKP